MCGDGIRAGAEGCDDGNLVDHDGCDSDCVRREKLCNNGLDDDGDGLTDGADPDCQIAAFSGCAVGQEQWVFFSKEVPRSIPDQGSVDSRIVVSTNKTLQRAAVYLDISHRWVEDVDILLFTPSAASFDLSSDNGGNRSNYRDTVFDSTCATHITSGTAPFTGCYQPEMSLSSLAGTSSQGTWTLRVSDDAFLIGGQLERWALVLCTSPCVGPEWALSGELRGSAELTATRVTRRNGVVSA